MTEAIQEAQEYLTVISEDQVRRIVNIETLLETHSREVVLSFLKKLLRDKEKKLKDLVSGNRTDSEIDHTISRMFRIHMAIKAIERDGREVKSLCHS